MSDDDTRSNSLVSERRRDEEELFAEHLAHPRGRGVLTSPIATVARSRPVCGDTVTIMVGLGCDRDGVLARVQIRGNASGCAVHRVSTSLLCEVMEGCSVEECAERHAAFCRMMRGGMEDDLAMTDQALLKDAIVLRDIRRFPARLSCVMTAWDAFDECLDHLARVLSGKKDER